MSLIKVEHLRKAFEKSVPLEDINFEVHPGDVICVIGPSGTGKSTLLRCLNRLEEPSSGTITVDDIVLTDPKCDLHHARRKVGMVFQSFNLFNNLNVIENVISAPIHLLKMPREEAFKKGMDLLKQVGMDDRADRFPDELSGGQKQRVSIVRAIAMQPKVLLLDEPTSALDPTMTDEVLSVIRKLAEQGMTMIIVTHEMKFARDIATRVFYLDEGIIYEEGTPEQIFEHPQKEKTRRFIKRLKTTEIVVDPKEPDYLSALHNLEAFGRSAMLDETTLRKVILFFEELVINTICKHTDAPVRCQIEYSDTDSSIVIKARYDGEPFNPFKEGDPLSQMILSRMASETAYRYEDENKAIIKLEVSI